MSPQLRAYLILCFSPLFFSSNIIIGSVAVQSTEPFTLTFLRWIVAFALILPFAAKAMHDHQGLFREQWKLISFNAFLAIGLCGAGVYWALKYTSATNGTLIYTTSPVLIILIERIFIGRSVHLREIVGITSAILGILFIIFRGSLEQLLSAQFNAGDLLFVMAATSWAVYSVLSRRKELQPVPTVGMFAIVAIVGALMQVPFMVWELAHEGGLPASNNQWLSILGLGFISSVLAFTAYQYGIKILGASTAGIFMYLLPPVGVVLAVVFLGEHFQSYHFIGLILVMSGVITATFPMSLFKRSAGIVS